MLPFPRHIRILRQKFKQFRDEQRLLHMVHIPNSFKPLPKLGQIQETEKVIEPIFGIAEIENGIGRPWIDNSKLTYGGKGKLVRFVWPQRLGPEMPDVVFQIASKSIGKTSAGGAFPKFLVVVPLRLDIPAEPMGKIRFLLGAKAGDGFFLRTAGNAVQVGLRTLCAGMEIACL